MSSNEFQTDPTRRDFISTPVKLIPAMMLASAAGLAPLQMAQAQTAQASSESTSSNAMTKETSSKKNKIVVIATGGTIAGTASSETEVVNYTAAQKTVDDLLAGIPRPDNCEFEAYQLAQVDSKDMSYEVWRELATKVDEVLARPDVTGIVITHGTDTLEETALFLDLMVDATKPVVLTAAMRPATALGADGPVNLMDAIAVAQEPGAFGILAVADGRILSGRDVRKTHTYRIDAFSPGEAGAIGAIEGGVIRQWRNWPKSTPLMKASNLPKDTNQWPWVEIVTSDAGTNGMVIPALLGAGVQGIVIAATGNGTINETLVKQAKNAQAKNIPVVRAARVNDGVIQGDEGDGIPKSEYTLPVKARVFMIVQLLANKA